MQATGRQTRGGSSRGEGRPPYARWFGAGLALLLVLSAAPRARGEDPALAASLRLSPASPRAGEYAVLELELRIPEGFKLYGSERIDDGPHPTRITLAPPEGIEGQGPWWGPAPTLEFDKGFHKDLPSYHGTLRLQQALAVAVSAEPGPQRVTLRVTGQICDPARCILQRLDPSLDFDLEPGPPRAEQQSLPRLQGQALPTVDASASPAASLGAPPPELGGGGGVLGYLLTAFLAGLLALLTPCVFPMIPLTVSFFSKASEEHLGRGVYLAAVYALSIVLTFTVAGVLISIVFGAAGLQNLAAHPLFNLLIAAVLLGFGLSLLGLFELSVPSGLIQRSESLKRRFSGSKGPGVLSVVFMALTFTLVSFSCTVAFVGGVVVAAARGEWFWPTLGMLAFSTAFALPFFLLALFPRSAQALRGKGGDWLPLVKVLLGFLEMAAAFKFLSNVDLVWDLGLLSRGLVLALWFGLFGVATLYILKLFRFSEDPPPEDPADRRLSVPRLLLAALALAWTAYLGSGMIAGRPFGNWVDGWLPPSADASFGDDARGGAALRWFETLEEAQEEAKRLERPLFLNFTGVTCTNCRYMEEGVLSRADVAAELARFVTAELYTDRGRPADERHRDHQVKTFGTAALPFYAIVTPSGRTLASFPGSTNDPEEFLRFLRSVPAVPLARSPKTAPPQTAPAPSATPPPAWVQALRPLFPGQPPAAALAGGRWILVNHWASWCSPCRAELEAFFPKVAADFAARGVDLLTLAYDGGDEATEEAAREFGAKVGLQRFGAALMPADVGEATLPDALRPTGFPTTQLVAPDGRVVLLVNGEMSEADLRGRLERALAEERSRAAASPPPAGPPAEPGDPAAPPAPLSPPPPGP